MKINVKLSLIVIFCVAICSSCRMNVLHGSGPRSQDNPSVPSFNSVEMQLPFKLNINMQPGAQPSVQLSGYENVIRHIKTKVQNNTLILYTDLDETWRIDGDGISGNITMPAIEGLYLKGASDADIHGDLTGSYFEVEVTGASTMNIDSMHLDSFSVNISGAGDLHINGGTAKYAEFQVDGAGKIKAYPLQASMVSATIDGAGVAQVTATDSLEAEINGAGTIKYKGHPQVSKEVSGAGTIKEAN